MPGTARTVTLNLIGDTSSADRAFAKVAQTGEQSAGRIHGAFTNTLGMLNSTGVLGPFGEAITKASEGLSKVHEAGLKQAGAGLMAGGGAVAGIGALGMQLGAGVERSTAQLKQAVDNTGDVLDKGSLKISQKMGENVAVGIAKTNDALMTLTTGLGSQDKAFKAYGTVLDMAKKAHEDVGTAAEQYLKILEGKGGRILATYGINVMDATKSQHALTAATNAHTGAEKTAATADQHLADVRAQLNGVHKMSVTQTQTLEHAVKAATDAHAKLADTTDKLAQAQLAAKAPIDGEAAVALVAAKAHGQAAASVEGWGGKMEVFKTKVEDSAAQLGQKYGPAVTAVGAGITGLGATLEIAAGVMGKFKRAQEVATVATEGLTVAESASAVAEGVALAPILLIIGALALLGVAVYEVVTHWDVLSERFMSGAKRLANTIDNDLVQPVVRAFHWMQEEATKAINFIIDGWNGLSFKLPTIDTHIPGVGKIGGSEVGVPQIPRIGGAATDSNPANRKTTGDTIINVGPLNTNADPHEIAGAIAFHQASVR